MPGRGWAPLLITVVIACSGCLHGRSGVQEYNHSQYLRARLANEYGCIADTIIVYALGGGAYRVTNCGPPGTYVCQLSAADEVVCAWDAPR